MTETYVELHARSAFSFLEGASPPESLIDASADAGLPAVALLDRNGVYGAPKFYLAGKRRGVRAHVGAELALTDGTHLPLLVMNRTGYQNLCRLITKIKLRSPKGEGAASYEELAEHSSGLICLTGSDDGPLAKDLSRGMKHGMNRACCLVDIFGRENVYGEIQRHYDRAQEARNQAVVAISRKLGLRIVATNAVTYSRPDQRELLDCFTCIRNHVRISRAGKLLSKNSERFIKSAALMSRLFRDLPEAIETTLELSSRLEFTMESLGYEFPHYPVPPGETEDSFLRKRTIEGARVRYNGKNGSPTFMRARKQLEHELQVIQKLKLSGYFLIVWDIVNFCRDNNVLVQGRGSAANSAVCYSLGITAVDPVGMDLLFERFLSEQRGEWPDIDLDLPSGDRRESAIQYVYQRYGKLGAAMTANVITYRDRSAVREIGKVLGFDGPLLERISKLSSKWEWQDPNDSSDRYFKEAGLDIGHPKIRKFLQLCLEAQDLPRHLGQHSGGMVICQGSLASVVPLEPASMPGRVVVQWDKDDCADMGIIKVDLLGLGMMAALEDSLVLIRSHYGKDVDLAAIPKDDPEVYDSLQKADTVGLFQVESRAQMSCLPRLRPTRFYDIVVQIALIRPGPIVGNMVHPYLKRRQGREPPACLHPSLEPALKRTLGVPLFQEQLLKMAMICAGFSGGEAEELRRAFGYKRPGAKMRDVEVKLRRGMEENGLTGAVQDEIVRSITSFAAYGFPESHAASFALIAYASAYIKIHFPEAFTVAILNNQPMGFYHPATLVKDAQRHSVRIKPVDVTRSDWLCKIEQDEDRLLVRLGLNYVRGLRAVAGNQIVAERGLVAFKSIDDFRRRVTELNKAEMQKLAKVGALNFINSNDDSQTSDRRGALWQVERASRRVGPLLELAELAELADSLTSPKESGASRRVGPLFELAKLAELGDSLASPEEYGASHRVGPLLELAELADSLTRAAEAGRHSPPSNTSTDTPSPPAKSAASAATITSTPFEAPTTADEDGEDGYNDSNPIDSHDWFAPQGLSKIASSPLRPMTPIERLAADMSGTGLTIGPHAMTYVRSELEELGIVTAVAVAESPNGALVTVAGLVIVRQRPGSAKGFLFMSLEDETGISNIIVKPDTFDQYKLPLLENNFLIIDGIIQKQSGAVSVKATHVQPLNAGLSATRSRDFQ
jgi:error-prone DNA polymerase